MYDVNFLISNGVDVNKSLELFGDIDTYNETVGEFLVSAKEKIAKLQKYKDEGQKFSVLTAYDYSTAKYIDEDLKYFLFFVHTDSHPRYFNPVEHESMYCNCKFSANWDWFKGSTIIDAYRMMMEISTDHSQVVLDPFMDAGDVGEAAILQDRDFIGIEISRARFDDTKARLDDLGE